MSSNIAVLVAVVVASLSAAACTPRNGSAKQASPQGREATPATKSNGASSAPASELSKSEAEHAATQWLNALRSRDRAQLEKLSALPFELRELVEYPKCQPARASKPGEIPDALACLLEDQLLMEELAAQPAPVTEMIATADLPSWAASLRRSPPGQGRLVHIRLPGNGVSYQILLLAGSSGVHRVWKFAEYDPN